VYGISVDSPFSHGVYRTQLNLPDRLTLLSDFNRDFGRAYGILNTTASGLKDVLRRTVFIVGQDGRLTYRWDNTTPPSLPKSDDVLGALDRPGG
jgi:glutaredoxin-dependent peroxiredoxin